MTSTIPPVNVVQTSRSPFGAELRRMRRAVDLNLVDVAEHMDCALSFVSAIERGQRNIPDTQWLAKLLRLYGAEQEADRMVVLAARSRGAVELKIKAKNESEEALFAVLARMSEDGSLATVAPDLLNRLTGRGSNQ